MKPMQLLILLAIALQPSSFTVAQDKPPVSVGAAASAPEKSPIRAVEGATSAASATPDVSPTVKHPNKSDPLIDWLDRTEAVMKIVAYVVGATWVYFNYFKGRTYKSRLEIRIDGELLPVPTARLAKLATHVKNVGLAKVELLESGSGVRVEGYDLGSNAWTHVGTYEIYDDDEQWIEPAETLEGQLLVPLGTNNFLAYRAQLIVNCGNMTWESSTIFSTKEPIGHVTA